MLQEADAIRAAAELGPGFSAAVDIVDAATAKGGTVLVSGLGKSGLIGQKIAATLASLGVPAHWVHPTEAAHGDLGRFRPSDAAICLSHSGETDEVVALAAVLRQDGIPVIAITKGREEGRADSDAGPSRLERLANATLADRVTVEASHAADGSPTLAPTSSTTVALVLGDALALAVARRRSFTDADFARRHPGGQLGGMLRPVVDLLRFEAGVNLPLIGRAETVRAALEHAGQLERRPGAMLVVDEDGSLAGIFTDGDLRRLILGSPAALDDPIERHMTASPRTLPVEALARDAVNLIREHRADEIPVVDRAGKPVGLLDVQDLVAMRLVGR